MEAKAAWSMGNIQMTNQLSLLNYKADDETLSSASSSSR